MIAKIPWYTDESQNLCFREWMETQIGRKFNTVDGPHDWELPGFKLTFNDTTQDEYYILEATSQEAQLWLMLNLPQGAEVIP